MYKNNFDTSTSGVNIEFSGCRDNSWSWIDFNDNIEVLTRDSRGDACLCFYKDFGQIKAPETIGDVFKFKKGTTKKDLLSLDWYYSDKFNEIKREILSKSIKDWDYYSDVLCLKDDFEQVRSCGYCQGDFCQVLINKTALKNLWGNAPDIKALSEDIDHYCWDSPINALLRINNVEYLYDEYDLDRYDWQREEFAERVAQDSGVKKDTLLALMPEYLDYN